MTIGTTSSDLGKGFWESLVENSPLGIACVSNDGAFIMVNPTFLEMTGYKEAELIGRLLTELVHPADKELLNLDKSTTVHRELRLLSKRGIIVSSRITVSPFENGNKFIVQVEDINLLTLLLTEHRRLYELPDQLLCTLNEQNEFRTVNIAFKYVLGYEEQDMIGKPVWDFIHPDDLEISVETVKIGATTVIHGFENRFRTKSGDYKWLRWTGTIIDGINYGTAIDITFLKETEAALRLSEERHRVLFETMLQGVVYHREDGTIISINLAGEEILGASKAEILGESSVSYESKTIKEDGTPFPGAEHPAMVALRTGRKVTGVIMGVFNPKEQRFRWINVSAVPLFRTDEDKPYQVYTVFDDITDQKNAELSLRQSESRFRQLADAMPQVVWTAEPDGRHDYFNRKWYEYTGLSEHEKIIEEVLIEVLHPEDRNKFKEVWKKAIEGAKEYEIEYRWRSKSGEYRWFLGRALPVVDQSGQVSKWFGTGTDIEEQKRIQSQLRDAIKLRDEFLSIASHELKTPLTSAKAYIQLSEKLTSSELPSATPYVKQAASSINKLQSLISELLDVSRIHAGKLGLTKKRFDLNDLTAEVIRYIQPTVKHHRLKLSGKISTPILADRDRIEQVLINLITNAVKYSPDSSEVLVNLHEEETEAIVAVIDHGIGIKKEDQEKIFDRYYRVESGGVKFQGLGIGLYIAAGIVRNHGGRIWVSSEPGKGSTFYFSLPLIPE